MSNFIDTVIARLKGDDATLIAKHNERKAKVAFKQQLAALEGRELIENEALEDAMTAYNGAVYPSEKIEDTTSYITGIKTAKDALDDAQELYDATVESIEFFTAENAKAFAVTKSK